MIIMLLLFGCNSTDKLNWKDYNSTDIAKLTSQGKTVFVYYTADWCVSCDIDERDVLNSKKIKNLFKDNNVVLVKADHTEYSNPNIKKDFETHNYPGVPMYIVYSKNTSFKAKLLPDLITIEDIADNI